jgi:transcriptional regulator with XRE-family HTH domain
VPSKVLIVLGENIKNLREKSGFTQERLAKSVGLTRGTINRAEKGHAHLGTMHLERIAAMLGVQDIDLYQAHESVIQPTIQGRGVQAKLSAAAVLLNDAEAALLLGLAENFLSKKGSVKDETGS